MFHLDPADALSFRVGRNTYDFSFTRETSDLARKHLHRFFIHQDLVAVVGLELDEGNFPVKTGSVIAAVAVGVGECDRPVFERHRRNRNAGFSIPAFRFESASRRIGYFHRGTSAASGKQENAADGDKQL